MQPSPRSPLLVVAAVVGTLALVVTGWLLGHGGGTAPAAAAATGSPDASGDRARDGVLVSGTGEVTGRPDTLVAQFGAEATAGTVDDALARADRALGRITDTLTKGGVDEADLQTAGLDIYPQYSDDGRQVTGYQAQQQLTVTFRDVDEAARLIGRAVSAGGDPARLSGQTVRNDDDSALLADARRKAFDDAKAKAELYGDAAGRDLGRVVSVTETVTGNDAPYPMNQVYAARDAAGSAAVDLQPGQQQLSVTVTVEWSFD
jgi:uncharacterized protein YggE